MCFYIEKGNKERVATKDIVVYKVLKLGGRSPFCPTHSYDLTKGERAYVNEFSFRCLRSPSDIITGGLHSFDSVDGAISLKKNTASLPSWICSSVHKFIIPKGTRYWRNKKRGEYVSLCLEYVEEVKL